MKAPEAIRWCDASVPAECPQGLGEVQRGFAPHAKGSRCEGCAHLRKTLAGEYTASLFDLWSKGARFPNDR